uniref:Helicase C-terminal domain-containing protein n=1 Tax=Caenorhabditis japonica TaxID=281687 RepID=A0A8R1E1T3_CAEJA
MFVRIVNAHVEKLARDALLDPVRIVQGEVGEANADVEQKVLIMPNQDTKFHWLCRNLVEFASLGKVIIFVTKKLDAEDVAKKLRLKDFPLVLLHGDMLQAERNENLLKFRQKSQILVATDVAARGLDIAEIRTVVNYDMARDIDTHVHRIGRTGRAGNKGTAYTLVTE